MTYLHRINRERQMGVPVQFTPRVIKTGQEVVVAESGMGSEMWRMIGQVGSLVGTAAGAYHGYKRNHGSIGMGIAWALLGGIFWPITIPVMFAQGIGKAK